MEYALSRLPVILLFANGYLLYSLFAATGLTGVCARRAARLSRGDTGRLLLTVMSGCALMSFFISNTITVLAFLPLLKTMDDAFRKEHGPEVSITTPLTLSAIYGANIGGMGSLIGSPANLLLIGALDYFQVPGREQVTFLSWFIWSVPLAAMFILTAWGVVLFALPGGTRRARFPVPDGEGEPLTPEQRAGGMMFVVFFLFWITESFLSGISAEFKSVSPIVCAGFFGVFLFLAFVRSPGLGRPLLRPGDLVSGLPGRGLILLGAVGLLIVVVRVLKLDELGAGLLSSALSSETGPMAIFFTLTLLVIFLTEIFSNTVVSATFFSLAFFAAASRGMDPLGLMIGVSIASTCAFMTPVATPCNALAFGEMRGVSLRTMLRLGAALNVLGALLMTVWLRFVIPLVYG